MPLPQLPQAPAGLIEDPLLNRLPFAVLLLPLVGFIVLALFGDWIRDQELEARAKGERTGSRANGMLGAMLMACFTVLTSFGLSLWSVARLLGLYAYKSATSIHSKPR